MPNDRSISPGGHPLLVIIGPSASGKSSLARELHRRRLVSVRPTWTTRARRPDEQAGSVEHRFVSDATFDRLEERGHFVDTVTMFGLPHRYGLPATGPDPVGLAEVVLLRAPLLDRFALVAPAFTVFQIEDTPERIGARLRARGTGLDELAARTADNAREIAAGRARAHRVFSNHRTIEALADDVVAAIVDLHLGVAA
jgi:guanylate kinase